MVMQWGVLFLAIYSFIRRKFTNIDAEEKSADLPLWQEYFNRITELLVIYVLFYVFNSFINTGAEEMTADRHQ